MKSHDWRFLRVLGIFYAFDLRGSYMAYGGYMVIWLTICYKHTFAYFLLNNIFIFLEISHIFMV